MCPRKACGIVIIKLILFIHKCHVSFWFKHHGFWVGGGAFMRSPVHFMSEGGAMAVCQRVLMAARVLLASDCWLRVQAQP